MPKSQHVRLLYVLPTFLIIVSTLIITSFLQPNSTNTSSPSTSQQFLDNYNGFSLTLPANWEAININRPQDGTTQTETEYLIKPTTVSVPNVSSLPESITGNNDYPLPGMYIGILRDEVDMDYYLGLSGRDCGECAFAFLHEKTSIGGLIATRIDSDFPPPQAFPNEQHRPYTYYLFNASGHGWIVAFPRNDSQNNVSSSYASIINSFQVSSEIGLNYSWVKHSTDPFLMYPSQFKLETKADTLFISHSISFSHPDPCNFSGSTETLLDQLTDFHLSLRTIPKNLKGTLTQELGKDFVSNNLQSENELTLSPGFIDKSIVGDLKGYRITQGVEGCGNYSYYFPIEQSKTLLVNRKMITELSPIISGFEKNLALPGVIPTYAEGKIFTRILSSIKLP